MALFLGLGITGVVLLTLSLVFDGVLDSALDGALGGALDGWLSLPVVAGFLAMTGFGGAIVLGTTGVGPQAATGAGALAGVGAAWLTYGQVLRPLVPLGEGVHGLRHRGQHAVRRTRRRGPGGPGGVQMLSYETAHGVSVVRGPLPEGAAGVEFTARQAPPGCGDFGQDLDVPGQIRPRRLCLGHSAPLFASLPCR
ncbi:MULTISPECIES: hypothetical protein [Streptomyces]|uniref:hypothetical protein n=1 Tax=Streptomyces TaxID=1883 RepID=UPI001F0C5BE2|nr:MULTISPECIES: hypothetical protein [Streptomyces]